MTRAHVEHTVGGAARGAVTVRAATADDLHTVVALRLALLRVYADQAVYGRLHPAADERAPDLCAQQMSSPRDAFFLADVGGAPVGMLRCTESNASPLLLPERFAYISSVFVRRGYRRRGVLRMLLASAREWCAARGLTQMRLHNVPGGVAAAAWHAVGFRVVEEVRTLDVRSR
jgi:GNAT superfamily N-acetyltransferase